MFSSFFHDEAGVVAVDWTVIAAGLTAAGISLMSLTGNALSLHSDEMRGELQDPHFDTDWFDNVAVPPPSLQD